MRASALLLFLCVAGTVAAASACADRPTSEDGSTDESNVGEEKDLFGPSSALPVKISAPLTTLFTRFKNNQPDPPKPPKDGEAPNQFQQPEFSEPGKLTITVDGAEKALDMRVYIRGESSKHDCPFPKLKIDFDEKEQLKGTPFKGHGKFRLNTHCGPGDASSRSGMGRVTNGVGPVREELVYRMVRAMGIPTYQTRVLSVHYEDTAAGNAPIDTFGVAIETGDDAAQRFKKMQPPLIPEAYEYLDPQTASRGRASPANLAEIKVAETFAGNTDYGGTHNIDSFGADPPTDIFQIAQDFDLTAITLGDVPGHWGRVDIGGAQASLQQGDLARVVASHEEDVLAAYREAEKAAIAAKAIPSADGAVTTDPGFLEAKKRMEQLYALPELSGGAAADAGRDAQ